jgi:hypothetical protein
MTNYHDIQFGNNAYGTLSQAYATTATSIVLTAGHGARFPTLAGNQYFFATLLDTTNNLEIVKVTARATDTLTIVRAQEGTTARAFATNDRIELRVTSGGLTVLSDLDEILPDQSAANGQVLTSTGGNAGFAALDITDFSSQNNTNAGFFAIPAGTTAQRPASPQTGHIRYNTDHYGGARPEFYAQNNAWLPLNSPILNKYIITASASASGFSGLQEGKFPSGTSAGGWSTDGFTINQFPLTAVNAGTHNILSVICKPMSTSSVFLIEVCGSWYNNTSYTYATIGRSTSTTAAGTTTGSTLNVGHIRNGGDGTNNTAPSNAILSWNHSASVHAGGFATYDTPNTTDFVRYCIHFSNDNDYQIYFPYQGQASMIVTEIDGTGTTKVSTDTPLSVNT